MNLFFDSWESFFRTVILTILAYIAMVFLLRISGKRTLSKMNAFDFIVTIALGSALSTVALNKRVPLAEGVLVFILFIFLQYTITWLSVRVSFIKKTITSQPSLLLYKGELMDELMKKERITIQEVWVAARKKGITKLEDIDVVVLETTGEITVIPNISSLKDPALGDVIINT
jgi:uncharacterized membrane protein YcaP (DUF421 family)